MKDWFIDFLEKQEDVSYEVVGIDVDSGGGHNVDYLIEASRSTKSLALEITLLADTDDEFARASSSDLITSSITEAMRDRIDEMNGLIVINAPYHPRGYAKRVIADVAKAVCDAAGRLVPSTEGCS